MLEHAWEWITSDTGWKVASASFVGAAWIIRRAGKKLRMQIQAIVQPLEAGIAENKKDIIENRAEISNLALAARDQNGANEKNYASKDWVNDRYESRLDRIERGIDNIQTLLIGRHQ